MHIESATDREALLATAVDLKKRDAVGTTARRSAPSSKGGAKRPPVKRLVLLLKVFLRRPFILHLKRAAKRFSERLGSQFAAAITYFSFLALVPILMLAFSIAGFVLSSHPDLLVQLQAKIAAQIPGDLKSTISMALTKAVSQRYSILSVGLVIALYSGIGWMGNVRQAVQAQWRPDFDDDQEMAKASFLQNLFKNLWMLAGLGGALVVSLALSSIGSALTGQILKWVGLANVGWLHPVVTVASLLLAVAADLLIFMWVYSVLPPKGMKAPRGALVRGSIIAAVGFEVLKYALTAIPKLTSGGSAYSVFGPIIGLLAFFNLVATLVLFVAAWISTAVGGPGHPDAEPADVPEVPEPAVVVRDVVSRPKLVGALGVGAILGVGWSRRRR